MATVAHNLDYWNERHNWPLAGDEWSGPWGGARAEWFGCILPRISPFLPAAHILEIAPGHGRWTQFLQGYATSMTLVDLAPNCIAACRSRFAGLAHLRYHVNDGRSLDMIDDDSVDFVFSFDSLIHADPDTMRAYCQQLARKLHVGGAGFLHHSNLGAQKPWLLAKRVVVSACLGNSRLGNLLIHDGMRDPGMTAALMRRFCEEAALTCLAQEIVAPAAARRPIDCFTVFRKDQVPKHGQTRIFVNDHYLEEAANIKRLASIYEQ